jgi:starch synthase
MKVVFVSSEIVPFASTGGLGDVAAALPKALAALGVTTFRMMPLYGRIDRERFRLIKCDLTLSVPMGGNLYAAEVWMQVFENVTTYYIYNRQFFDRPELYGEAGHGYEDNFERFLFFQKAAILLMDQLELRPDIVHCNDWQTALVPMLLHYGVNGQGRTMREKTLFTIHNLAYQGWAPQELFYLTGLPQSCYTMHTLEYFGEINSMKGGLVASSAINTVSPRYAEEIQTEAFGCGLHDILRIRRKVLHGILNGIDYRRWNPASDPHILANFSAENLSGKQECKRFLQEAAGLPTDPSVPLIGMISRLAPQKGIDLLLDSMDQLVESGAQLLVLGSGDRPYEEALRRWGEMRPDCVSVWIDFSSTKAHQIEAGSDLFLMPSAFEPCGQNQLFSMSYGTLPLVHSVGGLYDTVVDADEGEAGCGFKFSDYSPASLMSCLARALTAYRDPAVWNRLVQTAMKRDFSDQKMAQSYVALYQTMLANQQERIVDGQMVQTDSLY